MPKSPVVFSHEIKIVVLNDKERRVYGRSIGLPVDVGYEQSIEPVTVPKFRTDRSRQSKFRLFLSLENSID